MQKLEFFVEPRPTILTRDRALRTRFIILLRSRMEFKEIAETMGVTEWTVSASLRRLLYEIAYYIPKEEPKMRGFYESGKVFCAGCSDKSKRVWYLLTDLKEAPRDRKGNLLCPKCHHRLRLRKRPY